MVTGEGSFSTRWSDQTRVEELPARRFAARRHDGDLDDIETTRRPLYQHLIMHEYVGGPPVVRFRDEGLDVLVGAAGGFQGDDVADLVVVPQGWFAVMDYEGPPAGLAQARDDLRRWAVQHGHRPAGDLLQVHLMDTIEGVTQQQLQLPIET